MTFIVHSTNGEAVRLEDAPFAQGGEAAVYRVHQFPHVVVKIYHPQVLQGHAQSLQEKICAMAGDGPLAGLKRHAGLAWPRFPVFDAQGQWRGYAMANAAGKRMSVLAHARAYVEAFPRLDRPALVRYMLRLLATIDHLHGHGVLVGDYNPANFLCDPATGGVTLIDCDSWQFAAGGKTFRCPVAAPDMLPPELHGKELRKVTRTLHSELFSLAILLFKMLMLGRHPYDVIGGATPTENIRNGHFPYGLGGGGIPAGAWYNIWSHLPYKLKEQFVSTFRDGCRNPQQRTPVRVWIEQLQIYQRELDRGWHDTHMQPAAPKARDYRGRGAPAQEAA